MVCKIKTEGKADGHRNFPHQIYESHKNHKKPEIIKPSLKNLLLAKISFLLLKHSKPTYLSSSASHSPPPPKNIIILFTPSRYPYL